VPLEEFAPPGEEYPREDIQLEAKKLSAAEQFVEDLKHNQTLLAAGSRSRRRRARQGLRMDERTVLERTL
jgi:hypothetical protein